MKTLALLVLAFITASLLSPPAMADEPHAAPGPRPGTVEAMQCLVRQGPTSCEKMFEGRPSWVSARGWVLQDPDRDFRRGPLVSSTYWARASDSNIFDTKILIRQPTTEMDIFDVKFAHQEYTFYISPADGDGKIRALAILLYAPHDLYQLTGKR
jgi:hypothetical protein